MTNQTDTAIEEAFEGFLRDMPREPMAVGDRCRLTWNAAIAWEGDRVKLLRQKAKSARYLPIDGPLKDAYVEGYGNAIHMKLDVNHSEGCWLNSRASKVQYPSWEPSVPGRYLLVAPDDTCAFTDLDQVAIDNWPPGSFRAFGPIPEGEATSGPGLLS